TQCFICQPRHCRGNLLRTLLGRVEMLFEFSFSHWLLFANQKWRLSQFLVFSSRFSVSLLLSSASIVPLAHSIPGSLSWCHAIEKRLLVHREPSTLHSAYFGMCAAIAATRADRRGR